MERVREREHRMSVDLKVLVFVCVSESEAHHATHRGKTCIWNGKEFRYMAR